MNEAPIRIRRVLALARPELVSLSYGTLALLVGSGMALSYPIVVQQIIDGIDTGGGQTTVTEYSLLLLALFAVGSVCNGLRAWLFTVAGERVVARLRTQLYTSLVSQEIAFFDRHRTGELTNRLASDTAVLQNTVTVNLSMLLRFSIMSIGATGFLFYTSWRLTLVTLALVPIAVGTATLVGRRLRRVSRDMQDALARSNEVAEETLSGIRTVRAFAREAHESLRFGRAVEHSFLVAKRRAKLVAYMRGGVGFAGYTTIVAVLWFGGSLLVKGQMSIGELTSFLLYTLTAGFSLAALASLYEDLMKALGASERVFALLDRTPTLTSGQETLRRVVGHIDVDDVTFAYPERAEHPVLQNISFSLTAGQTVALVGPSGSGKSTIGALFSRFYDPTHGAIRLDGVPLTQLSPEWLREQIGVVSQEPILFATSIIDNIKYGNPNASPEEIITAATAANAHSFITDLPLAYETQVGERGIQLSGGQKQRIAIARALLKDPAVLVLDEATSALDSESEHLVQIALERLMIGRTTLVIAHRLSTVRSADRVLVLHDGRLTQDGRHDELINEENGLYSRLLERQIASFDA